jgi:hypothetical protein
MTMDPPAAGYPTGRGAGIRPVANFRGQCS